MIRIGVIGYGYWGPNLVRNFVEAPGVEVAWVCDLDEHKRGLAAQRYPGVRTTDDPEDLLRDPEVTAVSIATPVATHYPLALRALEAGKHVLVEKPITESVESAQHLAEEAERRGLVLMVGHTFCYSPAVIKIRELIASKEIGEVQYYDTNRINLGLFQHDVNVLWDLAVHDFSILEFVLGRHPRAISTCGMSHVPGAPENIAFSTLFFDGDLIAHVNVNWLAPVKLRQTLIGGTRKMIVYDDLQPTEKIKIYDKGITVASDEETIRNLKIGYRTGDMLAPVIPGTEALRTEVAHFADCIREGGTPVTGSRMGLRIVELLEAANRSMAENGRCIELTGQ